MESCTTTFVQYAGIAALSCPRDETCYIINILRERRDLLVSMLNTIDTIFVTPPAAGFYVFVNIEKLMNKLGFTEIEKFRNSLLEQTGIAVCTNDHFGPGKSEGNFLRFAFSGISKSDIEKGIHVFTDWIEKSPPTETIG